MPYHRSARLSVTTEPYVLKPMQIRRLSRGPNSVEIVPEKNNLYFSAG